MPWSSPISLTILSNNLNKNVTSFTTSPKSIERKKTVLCLFHITRIFFGTQKIKIIFYYFKSSIIENSYHHKIKKQTKQIYPYMLIDKHLVSALGFRCLYHIRMEEPHASIIFGIRVAYEQPVENSNEKWLPTIELFGFFELKLIAWDPSFALKLHLNRNQ